MRGEHLETKGERKMLYGAIAIFIGVCAFVCWFDNAKREAQKNGVCDFSGQGRDGWKEIQKK